MKRDAYLKVEEKLERLWGILKANPYASFLELKEQLGTKSTSYIQTLIQRLEERGRLRRHRLGKKTAWYEALERQTTQLLPGQVDSLPPLENILLPEEGLTAPPGSTIVDDSEVSEDELYELLSDL